MQVISCSAYEILASDKETTRDRNMTDKTERCTFIGYEHNIYRFLRKHTFLSKMKMRYSNNQFKTISYERLISSTRAL